MAQHSSLKALAADKSVEEVKGYPIFVIENPCCQAARKLITKRVL